MLDSSKIAASITNLADRGIDLGDRRRFNKPPTQHRWVPGQSGRPKYSADLCALVHALRQLVPTKKGLLRVLRTVDKSGEKIRGVNMGDKTIETILTGERYAPERASAVFRMRLDHYLTTLGPVFASGIEPSAAQMTTAKVGSVRPQRHMPSAAEMDEVERQIQQRKAAAEARRDAARAARTTR